MDITKQYREQQEAKQLQNRISSFMKDFKVGTVLHGNGIGKLRGVSPLTLFTVIFSAISETLKGIIPAIPGMTSG